MVRATSRIVYLRTRFVSSRGIPTSPNRYLRIPQDQGYSRLNLAAADTHQPNIENPRGISQARTTGQLRTIVQTRQLLFQRHDGQDLETSRDARHDVAINRAPQPRLGRRHGRDSAGHGDAAFADRPLLRLVPVKGGRELGRRGSAGPCRFCLFDDGEQLVCKVADGAAGCVGAEARVIGHLGEDIRSCLFLDMAGRTLHSWKDIAWLAGALTV